MTTKIEVNDIRKNTAPTFKDIKVGSMFTEVDGEFVFIKINEVQIHYCGKVEEDIVASEDKVYNVMTLEGEFDAFYDDEEVMPVQEIEFTIKK